MRMDGVARCRPERDVKLLAWPPDPCCVLFQCDAGPGYPGGPDRAANLDLPVTSYSGGWKMKMQLCAAQLMNADVLMLDEPTGNLDVDNIKWLENKVNEEQVKELIKSIGFGDLLGMTTRKVSSSSRRICLWMRRRLGRRSGALILVLCTTLRLDAFTDDESMIGDAIRIQRTPLSMPAACSLTRTWSKAAAPRSRVTGSEHLGTHSESRDTVWTPAKVTDLIAGVEILRITREIVRLYICHLHGYPSSSVWYLLFPKSAPGPYSGIEYLCC